MPKVKNEVKVEEAPEAPANKEVQWNGSGDLYYIDQWGDTTYDPRFEWTPANRVTSVPSDLGEFLVESMGDVFSEPDSDDDVIVDEPEAAEEPSVTVVGTEPLAVNDASIASSATRTDASGTV